MAVPVRRRNGGQPLQVWDPFTTESWDPVAEMRALTERFSQLLGQATGDWPGADMLAGLSAPLGELEEQDDAYLVRLEVPGVKRDDVNVELAGRRLTVQAERKQTERKGLLRRSTRRTGQFFFETLLPGDVDPDHVEATLEEGVLVVRLPKPESERRKTRKISVR